MKKLLLILITVCSFSNLMGQDWPNLDAFQEANKDVLAQVNTGDRIVLMGNSITAGWIKAHPEFFKENDLINRGIGGQTTPQMLLRFRQDVIDLRPKAVFILAGINDIAGNTGPSTLKMIEDNFKSMSALAEEAGIEVILCSLLPANVIPWRKEVGNPADKVTILNEWLKGYAEGKGYRYIDYYSLLVDEERGLPKEFSGDGIHPTSEGYEIMESVLLPIVKEIRGE